MGVNYPETILNKSCGSTKSEAYLCRLCNETFLSLWSYPNVFRDQGRNSKRSEAKGDGKELCDLLVVFDNHVIIFSDKQCAFPNSGNIQLDWSRWYNKTIRNAANQIWGAERWIFKYPNTIYIDSDCTQPFPFTIPSKRNAIIHRIVVAHGASKECIRQLGGTGSLMIYPRIVGDMHICSQDNKCTPFAIGQIDTQKGFVHVFDDTTLDVVMRTLDTISDFIRYLTRKEEFIQSGKLISAAGEDDLLACYLKYIDENGEHTFLPQIENNINAISITEGLWENICKQPSILAQIKANEISYSWDKLIEKFIFHVTTGTSYLMSHPNLKSQEEILRFLAKENRTRRRFLAEAIHDLIARTPNNYRATRTILPSRPGEPYYLFLLFPKISFNKDYSYEMYREARASLLADYLKIVKLKFPKAIDIIGLATETGFDEERSEDFMYLDASVWTEKENEEALEIEKELTSQGLLGKRTIYRRNVKEYPDNKPSTIAIGMKGTERNMPCPCNSGKKFKKCCGRN